MPKATISLTSEGDFDLYLPSRIKGESGHSIVIPYTTNGFMTLRNILQEQERCRDAATIGTKAAPTQQMVDEWLKAGNSINRVKVGQSFKDLGLTNEEIEAIELDF